LSGNGCCGKHGGNNVKILVTEAQSQPKLDLLLNGIVESADSRSDNDLMLVS
jgi:hypothetical protein